MEQDFNSWLESLKSRIYIADVISSYVSLVQKGSKKWACCPFHHEKTPSFCVDEYKGMYHCFGCGKGGDSISFVQEMENTDFMGAITILADKYNVAMPEFRKSGSSYSDLKQKKDKLYEMLRITAQYYHANLIGSQGGDARAYWASRGLSANTIKLFGLGYSLGYNQLVSYLISKGFSVEQMVEGGLVEEKNGKYFDAMAGRVVVPIINNLKQVIAFGGRVLEKDSLPKYKNTKETMLFLKSKELFGQHSIKRLKLEEPVTSIIIVEGYMDVISLYQAGVRNSMASMGTALTSEQARLLKRYCDKVYICYDGDSAGQKATLRGLDILRAENLDVKVISLPNNLDPDDFVRKYGKDGFVEQMASAPPLIEYKIKYASKAYDLNTAEGRGNYAVEAMDILREVATPAVVDAYMPMVEKISGIGKDILYQQYNSKQPKEIIITKMEQQKKLGNSAFDRAVRFVLYSLFGGVEVSANNTQDLTQYIIDNNQLRLYNIVRQKKGNTTLTLNDLLEMEQDNPEVKAIFEEGSKVNDDNCQRYFEDCVEKIIKQSRLQRISELTQAIDQEQDEQTKILLLSQLAQIKNLNKKA